ncbi:MAG: prepilin-type N-terminal cleavage/methylation domain-containing protein [Desulfobacterales bacterium]
MTTIDADMKKVLRPPAGRSQPGRNDFSARRGFTLLEILIAIFIFAVVITTVFGSFNFVFGKIGIIEESKATYEMAKDCLNRMTADLASAYFLPTPAYKPPKQDSVPDPFRLEGKISTAAGADFGQLRFTAMAHLPLQQHQADGVAEIIYYVTLDRDGKAALRRSDRLDFFEPRDELAGDPILCENVKSLTFTYLDFENDEKEAWDSDSAEVGFATPRAVRIRLEIGTEENFHPFETTVLFPQYRQPLKSAMQ